MSMFQTLMTEVERYRNRDFLEAAMATCALTALADRRVSLAERYEVDAILATMDRLKVYDPHEAIDILNGFLGRIEDDRETATADFTATIHRFADDDGARRALVRLAYLIITADGEIAPGEVEAFDRICATLGLSGAEIRNLHPSLETQTETQAETPPPVITAF
jgi:tellurite resistance protein TerB